METKVNDKVRLKAGDRAGKRGSIVDIYNTAIVVRLSGSDERIEVPPEAISNLSAAARQAWLHMPKRLVGRRKGLRLCDRTSVTLRIDRDLWMKFREMESKGVIKNRTTSINRWFREKLSELEPSESKE